MRLIYVAGPYRSETEWGLIENIRNAEKVAIQLWQMGYAVICPHKNTAFFGGLAADQVWLEGDLEMVRRCDVVMCIEGWEKSTGATGEKEEADRYGIPVLFNLGECQEWLVENGGRDVEKSS